ncbi:MAG: hypothetical protein WBQ05_13305, partial [Candidatus Competibacter denitrificans]
VCVGLARWGMHGNLNQPTLAFACATPGGASGSAGRVRGASLRGSERGLEAPIVLLHLGVRTRSCAALTRGLRVASCR